ncbi:LOW QUALITY PROTEIN: tectonic-1-like [Rhipicephalus sanguineus]|uniref:LOW QUALITY PROTEIN: tectonic-1-like n=1 Tax=Rhipicephalus sanguineus TaxID=34632 RepID=UPI001893AE3C|nr:LOW QUALITY PROTEIN: tectonic-1-like [Rhipicephalus sanguineus]
MQLLVDKPNGLFLAVSCICCTLSFAPFASANEMSTDVTAEMSNVTTALSTIFAEETSQPEQTTAATTVTQATDVVTTTVTPLPATATPPRPSLAVTPTDRCGCDLTAGSCDVDCCCDGDCSPDDSRAFQLCTDREPGEPDLRYCTKRDVVFRNRTLFEKRPVGDLLCIVVDNVKKKDVYPDPPEVKTLADAHSLIKGRVTHDWPTDDAFRREPQALFKAGSPVLRVDDDGSIGEWRLPTKLFSSRCEATEVIMYLRDADYECRRKVTGTLERSCSSDSAFSVFTYHSNFSIQSRPDEKLKIESFVCYNDTCLVANTSDCAPRYVDGSCDHVVSEASFRVFHNGADGISRIDAHYKLVTLKPGTVEFGQRFSVSFVWPSSNETAPLKVSGNPGYITGLPVLAGCFGQNGSACREQDFPQFLSVPESTDGACTSPVKKSAVKFRYNVRTGCLLWPCRFPNCSALQEALLAYVIGMDRHVTHVASFGNVNRSRVDDFVPVLVENSPVTDSTQAAASSSTTVGRDACVLPVTEVRVYVMHARTEHASRPQEKVVSVLRSYGRGGAAEVRLSRRLPVEVTYSVNFVDVTSPRRRVFAPPPTIDARLPQDFFYPFFLESSASKYHSPSAISCSLSLALLVVFAAADFSWLTYLPLLEHC